MGIYLPQRGAGKHVQDLSDDDIVTILQGFFAGSILFDLGLSLAKLSALVFYARIFGLRRGTSWKWKLSFGVVVLVTVAWRVSGIPYTIWQCHPVQKYWYTELPGYCLGEKENFVSSAIVNDIFILVLPLPMLFKLQVNKSKKWLVMGTFLVGYRFVQVHPFDQGAHNSPIFSIPLLSIGRLVVAEQAGAALLNDFTCEFPM